AEGNHGREEEAAGRALARRPRPRRRRRWRSRLEDGGLRAERAACPRRIRPDRGRRHRRGQARRLPRGEKGPLVRPLVTFDPKRTQVEAALAGVSRPWTCVPVAGGDGAGAAERAARVAVARRTEDDPGRGAAGKCGVTGREFQVERWETPH